MNPEEIENCMSEFRTHIVQRTNEEAIENGYVSPMIYILGETGTKRINVIETLIPSEFLKSEESKDLLVEQIVPGIIDQLESSLDSHAIGISIIMEGWCWKSETPIDDALTPERYQEIKRNPEKVEIVVMSFETMNKSETLICFKQGTKKNEKGEWIEGVWLKPDEAGPHESSGRFSNILRKRLEQV